MHKPNGFSGVLFVVCIVVFGLLIAVGWRVVNQQLSRSTTPTKQSSTQTVSDTSESTATQKGVSLTPRSFSVSDLNTFYDNAETTGTLLSWAGPWNTLSTGRSVQKTASKHSLKLIAVIGIHRETNGKLQPVVTFDETTKQQFITAISDFAADTKPAYISLGNEINRIKEQLPNDYTMLISLFSDTTAAIKQKSPNTKVFTVFQYERLNGLRGGLFGGINDETKNDWQSLKDFDYLDVIAFTSYPYLIYKNPENIPADYYTRITSHTTKPVAFTEVGWPSGVEATGYESSSAEQRRYLTTLPGLLKNTNTQFVIWPFMFDQAAPKPFQSIGLIESSGAPKPSYLDWQKVSF